MMHIRKLSLLFILSILTTFVFSQGSTQLKLTVKDKYGKVMSGTKVTFTEMRSGRTTSMKTASNGQLNILLEGGKEWRISILKIIDWAHWYVKIPKSVRAKGEMKVTYNYEKYLRETRPIPDRRKLTLKEVKQNVNAYTKADKENGIIKIVLRKPKTKAPLSNYPVKITCFKLNNTYVSKTNTQGTAYFKVPIDNDYEIDLDEIENFSYIDLSNRPFVTRTKKLTYVPTNVTETVKGDTITQNLPSDIAPTSARKKVTLTLRGANGSWKNEKVYLKEVHGNKVFTATTDENGQVTFLLPIKKRYLINATYESNIDVIDLVRTRGIGSMTKSAWYRPDPMLQYPEMYIPTPERLVLYSFEKFLSKQTLPQEIEGHIGINGNFISPINQKSKFAFLRVDAWAPDKIENLRRKPANIAFVIDKSGSMYGEDRIDLVIEGLTSVVDQLEDDDFISIITFNDAKFVEIPAQSLKGNKDFFKEYLERMYAEGGTNIFNGLEAGYKEVQENYSSKKLNRVILLTDGYGSVRIDSIVDMSKKYNAQGIECSAVGVGTSYNRALLTQLTSHGGGILNLIESKDIDKVFTNEIQSIITPVAEKVKLEITYGDKLKFKQISGMELKEKANGKLKIKLKNYYAGANQLGLLQFELKNPDATIAKQPVKIKISYFDISLQTKVTKEETVYPTFIESDENPYTKVQENDKKIIATSIVNRALKVLADSFYQDDRATCVRVLKETIEDLEQLYPDALPEDIVSMKQEVEKYINIITNLKK